MEEHEQVMYCANDPCETEAVVIVEETNTPLCRTCSQAYMLGQASPHNHLYNIYDDPPCEAGITRNNVGGMK